jgi:hypothetical protein
MVEVECVQSIGKPKIHHFWNALRTPHIMHSQSDFIGFGFFKNFFTPIIDVYYCILAF